MYLVLVENDIQQTYSLYIHIFISSGVQIKITGYSSFGEFSINE